MIRVRRIALGALTTLISVNIWTGSPLLAVWLGSHLQRTNSSPSMVAIFAVGASLAVQSLILLRLLTALNRRYDAVLGREPERWQAPWLKSMRAERASDAAKRQLNFVERAAIASVVLAVALFEVWFFFFAGSSLPNP